MKYIIEVNYTKFVVNNLEDAKHLFDALMNAKVVDYDYNKAIYIVANSYRIEINEVEDEKVITSRESIIIPAPVDEMLDSIPDDGPIPISRTKY